MGEKHAGKLTLLWARGVVVAVNVIGSPLDVNSHAAVTQPSHLHYYDITCTSLRIFSSMDNSSIAALNRNTLQIRVRACSSI